MDRGNYLSSKVTKLQSINVKSTPRSRLTIAILVSGDIGKNS